MGEAGGRSRAASAPASWAGRARLAAALLPNPFQTRLCVARSGWLVLRCCVLLSRSRLTGSHSSVPNCPSLVQQQCRRCAGQDCHCRLQRCSQPGFGPRLPTTARFLCPADLVSPARRAAAATAAARPGRALPPHGPDLSTSPPLHTIMSLSTPSPPH